MLSTNEVEIYSAIKNAIIQQKLRPKMQIVEEVIAESFGVSRTPVRNVLRRLASEKLVTVIPYKGTFVSCPTPQDAKEVFEMRRVLEVAILGKVCRVLKEDHYEQLQAMLEEEMQAHKEGDVSSVLKITGDFHLRIAAMADNTYYSKYLEELISLTYVIIAFYGKAKQMYCHDHKRMLEAILKGDEVLAKQLLIDHLKEIEEALDFHDTYEPVLSLRDIFKVTSQLQNN